MATIIVNRFGLSAPIDNPMVATITSVEPRAFMPVPSASDLRADRPPSFPPRNAPPNLPALAMAISPIREQQQRRIFQDSEVGGQAGGAEEHRHEEGDDQPAQLLVDVLGQDRELAHQNAGDDPADTVRTPIRSAIMAMKPMISRMAVITAKSLTRRCR